MQVLTQQKISQVTGGNYIVLTAIHRLAGFDEACIEEFVKQQKQTPSSIALNFLEDIGAICQNKDQHVYMETQVLGLKLVTE